VTDSQKVLDDALPRQKETCSKTLQKGSGKILISEFFDLSSRSFKGTLGLEGQTTWSLALVFA
jgi:hypothetical protein